MSATIPTSATSTAINYGEVVTATVTYNDIEYNVSICHESFDKFSITLRDGIYTYLETSDLRSIPERGTLEHVKQYFEHYCASANEESKVGESVYVLKFEETMYSDAFELTLTREPMGDLSVALAEIQLLKKDNLKWRAEIQSLKEEYLKLRTEMQLLKKEDLKSRDEIQKPKQYNIDPRADIWKMPPGRPHYLYVCFNPPTIQSSISDKLVTYFQNNLLTLFSGLTKEQEYQLLNLKSLYSFRFYLRFSNFSTSTVINLLHDMGYRMMNSDYENHWESTSAGDMRNPGTGKCYFKFCRSYQPIKATLVTKDEYLTNYQDKDVWLVRVAEQYIVYKK